MNATTKHALFGGALFAAGITAAAQAQWTIDPSEPYDTFTQVFAVSYTSGHNIHYFTYGVGTTVVNFDSFNEPSIGGVAGATVSNSYIGAYLNITSGTGGIAGNAYATADSKAIINVSSDTKIQADWDFTNYNSGLSAYAFMRVKDRTTQSNVFSIFILGTAGSTSIDLLAGHDCILMIYVSSGTESTMWGSFTKAAVPAPGSLALLDVAAMGARRRRRSTCRN